MTSQWYDRDLPVLQAIVQLKDERPGQPIPRADVAEMTGLDPILVKRAVVSLTDEPYIVTDGTQVDRFEDIKSVNGAGKRAAGVWPTPENLADTVRDAILRAAEQEPDPEKRGKLKAVGTWLAEGGRDIITGVISGALTGGRNGEEAPAPSVMEETGAASCRTTCRVGHGQRGCRAGSPTSMAPATRSPGGRARAPRTAR